MMAVIALTVPVQADTTHPNHQTEVEVIQAAREASNQAIAAHDVAALASFWDEEYVIAVSTGAIEHSPEESRVSFAQHFKDFPDVIYVRSPAEIIVSDAYPLAWERGTWVGSMTTENGALRKSGQYASGWRKVDGVWKIRSELFVGITCEGKDC